MLNRRHQDALTPLLAALAVILVLAVEVFRPFLLDFTVAIAVAVLLAPAQNRLAKALGGRRSLSATLLVLLATLVIFIPVLTSLVILVKQTLAFFDWAMPHLDPEEMKRLWSDTLPTRFPALRGWILRTEGQLTPLFSNVLTELMARANSGLQSLLSGLAKLFFDLMLFLIMLFFLLKDGPRLKAELRPISPFSELQERQIFDHLDKTVKASLQAMVAVPLAQGLLAGVGFALFGVPSPMVWATVVILASNVPVLGSPLGWVPAVVYLFVDGRTWPAVGLFLFGLLLISGIDNVVKPLILRGGAQIHPLLGFLAILGGVLAFGFHGFLVGPVILSLVLSAIRIYRLDVMRSGPATVPETPAPAPAAPGPTLAAESARTA
jgi:predicted PurR-regulated permease PerM